MATPASLMVLIHRSSPRPGRNSVLPVLIPTVPFRPPLLSSAWQVWSHGQFYPLTSGEVPTLLHPRVGYEANHKTSGTNPSTRTYPSTRSFTPLAVAAPRFLPRALPTPSSLPTSQAPANAPTPSHHTTPHPKRPHIFFDCRHPF